MNRSLWREVVVMALDTLRTNKMRSALTVLGVVIGITSIVGMTSLIRGFDESVRDAIRQLGPNTIVVQKMGALSFASGKSFLEEIEIGRKILQSFRRILPKARITWIEGNHEFRLRRYLIGTGMTS